MRAVNLGQGFPDDPGPPACAPRRPGGDRRLEPISVDVGMPELREAVADHDRRIEGLELDRAREMMVTSGATEALAGACWPDRARRRGRAVPAAVRRLSADGSARRRRAKVRHAEAAALDFDEADLAAAFTDRTRVVLFNNPLNPTGVVYGREPLEILARACVRHDAVAVCDEVWEQWCSTA